MVTGAQKQKFDPEKYFTQKLIDMNFLGNDAATLYQLTRQYVAYSFGKGGGPKIPRKYEHLVKKVLAPACIARGIKDLRRASRSQLKDLFTHIPKLKPLHKSKLLAIPRLKQHKYKVSFGKRVATVVLTLPLKLKPPLAKNFRYQLFKKFTDQKDRTITAVILPNGKTLLRGTKTFMKFAVDYSDYFLKTRDKGVKPEVLPSI